MGLFVDLIKLSEPRTNAALEFLCKANHDDEDAIWQPMDSPFLARIVQLFTDRGLLRLDAIKNSLIAWASGKNHKPSKIPIARPNDAMERWTPDELSLVKLYLNSLPVEKFTLDDWMMTVDYTVQRYMGPDDMRTEAEWLATRANLMGRVQANMAKVSEKKADDILVELPTTQNTAEAAFPFTPRQTATLEYARVHAAENVRKLTDDVRHQMRGVVAEHAKQSALGEKVPALQSLLIDKFAALNRDWRRIAVTEAGTAQCEGFIASLKPGSKVKRMEHYKNACAFCRSIDGKVMNVVDPSDPNKDGETDIWAGKDNFGRSASSRKREGDKFVERDPHELWWVPAGLVHPNCRGRWENVVEDDVTNDPAFADWLEQIKALKEK